MTHRRFEQLEPRFLLSSTGIINGGFSAMSTRSVSSAGAPLSPPAVESKELPVAAVEDRADEFISPTAVEPLASPPIVSSPVVGRLSPQEPKVDSQVEVVASSSKTRNLEPAVPTDATSYGTISFVSDEVAEKESVSRVSSDTASTRDVTPTLPDDRLSLEEPIKKVVVKSSPTLVAVAEPRVAAETYNVDFSEGRSGQRSLSEAEATAEVVEEVKPTTTDKAQDGESATNRADVSDGQEADKDEGLSETDSSAAGSELVVARKAWLAVEQETDTSEKTASNEHDPDEKLHGQTPAEVKSNAAPQAQATVAASSHTDSRNASNQTDQGIPFSRAADRVFSEEQPDSGGRWAASGMLPPVEGALLLVTIGKPLTRLAVGDGRVDGARVDCGLPGARTTFDRSRRNRRKTAEARDQWQRRGDARELTWLPPEELPIDVLPETMEPPQEQAVDQRSAEEPIAARLADLAISSHLDVARPEDRRESAVSWLPTQLHSIAWDGYGVLGGVAVVTLSGTISALAVDRYRCMHEQSGRVKLPTPVYTGRTLSRA